MKMRAFEIITCSDILTEEMPARRPESFPSVRNGSGAFVSPRNIDKARIEAEDFIFVTQQENGAVGYHGKRKPSVDSAVQLKLYENLPAINFMIHGHAHVRGAEYTKDYFPCGDLREVEEILHIVSNKTLHTAVNLKNHGFLIQGNVFMHRVEALPK